MDLQEHGRAAPVGVDFTALLAAEVTAYMLEVGGFTPRRLAPLRLVNRALCSAASLPQFYREAEFSTDGLAHIPAFVGTSMRSLKLQVSEDIPEIDLGAVAERFPNLTRLESGFGAQATKLDALAALSSSLRHLSLSLSDEEDVDAVRHLTGLECLSLPSLAVPVPAADFPALRRLTLESMWYDPGTLLPALAVAPYAATLEALVIGSVDDITEVTNGQWARLADLPSLRELGLHLSMDTDLAEVASVLPTLTSLTVLSLEVGEEAAIAVLSRGCPPGLRALQLVIVGDEVDPEVVSSIFPVLPSGLLGVSCSGPVVDSADDITALLAQCPGLRMIDLELGDEAVEAVAAAVDPLLVAMWDHYVDSEESEGAGGDPFGDLSAAGHTVANATVRVDWRLAGGIFLDGMPVVRWF